MKKIRMSKYVFHNIQNNLTNHQKQLTIIKLCIFHALLNSADTWAEQDQKKKSISIEILIFKTKWSDNYGEEITNKAITNKQWLLNEVKFLKIQYNILGTKNISLEIIPEEKCRREITSWNAMERRYQERPQCPGDPLNSASLFKITTDMIPNILYLKDSAFIKAYYQNSLKSIFLHKLFIVTGGTSISDTCITVYSSSSVSPVCLCFCNATFIYIAGTSQ